MPVRVIAVVAAVFLVAACQTNSKEQVFATTASQVELRSYQQRAFDTEDKETTLRTVMATMQDLGFVLDKADSVLGTVSGTKLDGYMLRMTVTLRPRSEQQQTIVRANAQFGVQAVEDPEPYQQFFASLEKSMFLEAHEVD
jgi:hypothetical protein